MNQVILIGRLTKDPELRETSNGKPVASFTLAVDKFGEGADFINCVVWNKQAENLAKYQKKGGQIGITGRLQTRDYDDEKGNKRFVTEVIADRIEYLGEKKETSPDSNQEQGKQEPVEDMGFTTKTTTQETIEYTDSDLPW
ncbi:MAG: single-stranded DNA-binding protein [Bacteroidales bacterium]|nr:single-stranded DNA-binding protein [Bacteroidales bacterium]